MSEDNEDEISDDLDKLVVTTSKDDTVLKSHEKQHPDGKRSRIKTVKSKKIGVFKRSKRNILSSNQVSNSIIVPLTVRINKNNIFTESSDENSSVEKEANFQEGFTTFLQDKKPNAPTRSRVLTKMKHDLSFVNPSDGKYTQKGIIRLKNKRTQTQTHGIFDRVIYTYSVKDKAHVISHRELVVSPRTLRRRRAIKNTTENLSTNIHRKHNASILRQLAKLIQQNTEDISDCTSSDDDLYEQESSICASPSVAKIRPNFYDKLRKNEVIEEEAEENGSDVELKGSLPQAQSIHKDIAKSSFPWDLDDTDLGHGYNKLDSATRSSSRQSASESLINFLSSNDVSNCTVRRNKNSSSVEESFHEGFTTFLKDKKANAPTRSTVLSKMKHGLSFVNPSDGKCTQQGIIRTENKRTRAQTHGMYDRVIYTYSAKDKAHVISHREVAVSPRTVRRRQAIKNVTENRRTNIHRKYNVSKLLQFAKPDYMDLSKYSQSPDGESVTIIDPDAQMVLVKKVIISEDEYKEGYGDFVEKHQYRLKPKYFSKRLLNTECETVLEVRSPSTRDITVLVVIDECSIQLRSPQRLVVPRDVWHFFYNDNTVIVTVTTHGRDQNQSSSGSSVELP